MKKHFKWKIFKRATLIITILTLVVLHFWVPRVITEIKNPFINSLKQNQIDITKPQFGENQLEGKFINFKSFDDLKISSYLTYSSLDTIKGTIIMLHGIRSSKESFIGLSSKLSKLGYNSVALDSRAHGQSEGTHCTFGVKEKKDISKLIDILTNEEKIANNIGVWGKSLGGAIGLQAVGNDKRIKFAIIESTFSDFKTITKDYFKYHLGFNIDILTNYLVYRAGQIANFDIEEAKPLKYCENINQPILIVHGNKDQRIDIKYARQNFEKIPSEKKEFIEVQNANHLNVWKTGGEKYFNRILKFIE
jgi:dipeptidyl aminopeptidase/acylaminoacyl peptidase